MSGVWDAWRPELDTDPPFDLSRPATNYVVCSTPRSGSGLLCRGLAATGHAGTPAEYFNANQRVPLSARWRTGEGIRSYATALRARRTSTGGVFGTKLHWDQLERLVAELTRRAPMEPSFDLSAALLTELIPQPRFVRIVRIDLDRQAVSLWNALHRGVWSVRSQQTAPPTASPSYDQGEIDRLRHRLLIGEAHWDRFFRANRISPVEVEYESLIAGYPDTITRVMRDLLDVDLPSQSVPAPDSLRQEYPETEAVLARYLTGDARRPTTYDLAS